MAPVTKRAALQALKPKLAERKAALREQAKALRAQLRTVERELRSVSRPTGGASVNALCKRLRALEGSCKIPSERGGRARARTPPKTARARTLVQVPTEPFAPFLARASDALASVPAEVPGRMEAVAEYRIDADRRVEWGELGGAYWDQRGRHPLVRRGSVLYIAPDNYLTQQVPLGAFSSLTFGQAAKAAARVLAMPTAKRSKLVQAPPRQARQVELPQPPPRPYYNVETPKDVANAVRELGKARPGDLRTFHGDRIFIASLFDAADWNVSLPAFKALLVGAHRKGLLRLTRADLVGAMDLRDVERSEAQYLSATFHFLVWPMPDARTVRAH